MIPVTLEHVGMVSLLSTASTVQSRRLATLLVTSPGRLNRSSHMLWELKTFGDHRLARAWVLAMCKRVLKIIAGTRPVISHWPGFSREGNLDVPLLWLKPSSAYQRRISLQQAALRRDLLTVRICSTSQSLITNSYTCMTHLRIVSTRSVPQVGDHCGYLA